MDRVLQQAIQYLHEEVRPHAETIDQDVKALQGAVDGLCSLNLMAMKRPLEYGGPAMSEDLFRTFQEEVARVSGALAFLQTQHQSEVSMISKIENEDLLHGCKDNRTLQARITDGKKTGQAIPAPALWNYHCNETTPI